MITPELITYIRKQLAAGVPRENIAKSLGQGGWSLQDLAQAFTVATTETSKATPMKKKLLLSVGFVAVSSLYAVYQYVANPQQAPAIVTSLPTSQQNIPANIPTPTASSLPANQPQSQSAPTAVNQAPIASAPPPQQNSASASTQTAPSTNQTQATNTAAPTPAPTQQPQGQYANGTYTGSPANAYYGTVQVEAIIQNGALADVKFLQYPNDRNTSRYINSQAMPALISEAIQSQSAQVDGVSGATDTSQAFIQSLGSALAQAKT